MKKSTSPEKDEGKAESLIIVESPAKTRTLKYFLGREFDILASMGHVRDLPKTKMGVDLEGSFRPTYVTIPQRRSTLARLKEEIKSAGKVYLATDPDREGEAIAWHLAEALKIPNPLRLEFHEITSSAVKAALAKPRPIDMHLVEAQQARRVLDRIVGYTISPLLLEKSWRRARSAGRVQSVAVRLVVDREREIAAFVPQEYWPIEAWLAEDEEGEGFSAKLLRKAGEEVTLSTEEEAQAALEELWNQVFLVKTIKLSRQMRNPFPPFTTSTLQQEASFRLGFSPRRTMQIAQQLYEGLTIGGKGPVGLITYMRTDAVRISSLARAQARQFISQHYGEDYLPPKPRFYRARRGAQEAHEAIRPTSVERTPDGLKPHLEEDQFRLYRLIWNRFLASQMASVRLAIRAVDISAGEWEFEAREVRIEFPGFSVVYPIRDKEVLLPPLEEGQALFLLALTAEQRFTEPPPRFTEASLVRELEANGIGRPSTYAPILETIRQRGYVYLGEKRHLRPTDLGFAVTDKLLQHFPDIMEVRFTASVEENLDKIEEGRADWQEVLRGFYDPFASTLEAAKQEMENIRLPGQPTDETCEKCGKPMVQRTGRTGPFLACSGFPECKHTRSLTRSFARTPAKVKRISPSRESVGAALQPPAEVGEKCPSCGLPMVVRQGPKGRFLGCSGYPKCRSTRPLPPGVGRGLRTPPQEMQAGEDRPASPEAEPENCDKCGKPMLLRRSRYGPFWGCSGYPECKNILRVKTVSPRKSAAPRSRTAAGKSTKSAKSH